MNQLGVFMNATLEKTTDDTELSGDGNASVVKDEVEGSSRVENGTGRQRMFGRGGKGIG